MRSEVQVLAGPPPKPRRPERRRQPAHGAPRPRRTLPGVAGGLVEPPWRPTTPSGTSCGAVAERHPEGVGDVQVAGYRCTSLVSPSRLLGTVTPPISGAWSVTTTSQRRLLM